MADNLLVEPLDVGAFAAYGDVIEFEGRDSYPINNGMADRYHALARVELGGNDARAVISLVRSRLFSLPHRVDHLECHPHGSQAFIPLDSARFIVVVGLPGPRPQSLRAFVSNGKQGINYHAGTWHHVLFTPYAEMRFICVDRDSPDDNCIDFHLPQDQQCLLDLSQLTQ